VNAVEVMLDSIDIHDFKKASTDFRANPGFLKTALSLKLNLASSIVQQKKQRGRKTRYKRLVCNKSLLSSASDL
jgi:hypothetical protein